MVKHGTVPMVTDVTPYQNVVKQLKGLQDMVVNKKTVAKVAAGLGLALSLALSPVSQTSAQQGITWTTGFQVQNLGTATATVGIELYNRDGTSAASITNESITTSKTYYPVPTVAAGFQGSAVVSSDQPVAAIVNIMGNSGVSGTPFYSESVSGISSSATGLQVNLPLIMRGNSGFNTWFSVQNAGTGPATVNIVYTPGKDANGAATGTAVTSAPVTIPVGAAMVFNQAPEAGLGTKFIGSAKLTSDQALAVVVNQVGTGATKTLLTYSGFSQGSNNVVLPLIMQANATYFTGISIQNVGTTPANVHVTYAANTIGGTFKPTDVTVPLAAGASQGYIINGTDRYIGSATVTTDSTDQNVVVVVNQLSTSKGRGTAYEGISRALATSKVSFPLLMNANSNYFTGVQCTNLGATASNLTLTFSADTSTSATGTPPPVTANVAAGASINWLQDAQLGTTKYIGSGTVTSSTGSPVVCIVNELNNVVVGDAFLTYNGVNY